MDTGNLYSIWRHGLDPDYMYSFYLVNKYLLTVCSVLRHQESRERTDTVLVLETDTNQTQTHLCKLWQVLWGERTPCAIEECNGDLTKSGGWEWPIEALPKEVTFELRGGEWEVAGVREEGSWEEEGMRGYWEVWVRPRGPWKYGDHLSQFAWNWGLSQNMKLLVLKLGSPRPARMIQSPSLRSH